MQYDRGCYAYVLDSERPRFEVPLTKQLQGDPMLKPKILLVDDVKVFLEVQKEFLRPSPVRVLTAKTGVEAMETVRNERPDLVVMDVKMPEMDGITCCAAIKGDPSLRSTKVVLFSSDGSHEIVESARRAGCDRFLQKPVFGRDFLNMARTFIPVIERRRPRIPCRVPVTVQADGAIFEGVSRDIGMNGIYVATEGVVEPGIEVVASFRLPTNTYAMTMARGRVAWINPSGKLQNPELPAGFGIEFREITGEGLSHLRFCELTEFVNRHAVADS